MSAARWAVVLVVLGGMAGMLVALPTRLWALEREGSDWHQLAAHGAVVPSDVRVAVLPISAGSPRQAELVRGAVLLNLLRHGFGLVPRVETTRSESSSTQSLPQTLACVARATDQAVQEDSQREPGARLAREDAVRIGKALGATWVIYGELDDLKAVVHERLFRTRRVGSIDLRLAIADVATGDIVYWSRLRDTGSGGTGFKAAKATSIERRLTTRTVGHFFTDLDRALSEHKRGPEVTEDVVQRYIEAMGL